jgi:hypothetical protein
MDFLHYPLPIGWSISPLDISKLSIVYITARRARNIERKMQLLSVVLSLASFDFTRLHTVSDNMCQLPLVM